MSGIYHRNWILPRDASVCLCPDHAQFFQKASQVCVCPRCHRFFRYCFDNDTLEEQTCHHYKLIFTDGACSSNGHCHATSGIGIAIGETPDLQWSIPIDDSVDPYGKRTNQRAEVLAAIEGIKRMVAHHQEEDEDMDADEDRDRKAWIIASDSEYLVNSMVEWFPDWKANDWRASNGKQPANLDLFQELDRLIDAVEYENNVEIGFWWIPRDRNTVADGLAKRAAHRGL